MIRVDRISISNYKNIEVDELVLSNFNIIVGPNNSGKSNFIQIFSFLNHIINESQDLVQSEFKRGSFELFRRIVPLTPLGIDNEPISISMDYSDSENSLLFTYGIIIARPIDSPRMELYIREEQLSFKYINRTGPATRIFNRNKESIDYGPIIKTKPLLEIIPSHTSVINVLKLLKSNLSFPDEVALSIDALDLLIKTDTIYFSNIELSKPVRAISQFGSRTTSINILDEIHNLANGNPQKFDFLQATLNEILKITNIEVLEYRLPESQPQDRIRPTFFVRFRHLGRSKPLGELSDGTRMLVALVVRLISSENDLFLIEEPENSLHPKALIDLVNFIRGYESDKQFLITTHSISLINKVKPEDVIIAKTNESGKSILQRVPNLKELRKRLKQGYIVFSDALFFQDDDPEEEI